MALTGLSVACSGENQPLVLHLDEFWRLCTNLSSWYCSQKTTWLYTLASVLPIMQRKKCRDEKYQVSSAGKESRRKDNNHIRNSSATTKSFSWKSGPWQFLQTGRVLIPSRSSPALKTVLLRVTTKHQNHTH